MAPAEPDSRHRGRPAQSPAADPIAGTATAAAEVWDLLADGPQPPARNMAMDEALLLTAAQRGRPLLRFYAWDRPAVTIGYVQRATAAPATGYTVVRRPTGGGVVYHDHDLTYSVVLPPEHRLAAVERLTSYAWVNQAVRNGLRRLGLEARLARNQIPGSVDRATMVCFRHPTRYDVLGAGGKVAGSAQRRTRSGLLHQGSVQFGQPLPVPRDALAAAITEGFQEQGVHFRDYAAPPELDALCRRLEAERYAQARWNQRR
jgi:lipoate-protein ligase A